MNENHNHDKALEDAIERLVHGKKASGNELMDTLGATRPKANPSFMVNLEDRLMAELSSNKKEKLMMKRKEIPSKFGRWPLTMAAAVFAIVLVGGFALFMHQTPQEAASPAENDPLMVVVAIQQLNAGTIIESHMVAMQLFRPDELSNPEAVFRSEELVIGAVASAHVAVGEPILASQIRFVQNPIDTSMPMVPVVIAIQDIPEGTEITPAMVEVINFPAANAPSGAFRYEEDVVGYVAATTIYQEEIILVRKLMETSPIDEMEMTVAAIELTATAQGIPYIPLVIAIQDIPEGAEITAAMVEVIMFPAANAPNGAFVEETAVVGLTARTTIYTEEIILVRKVDMLEHCSASQDGTRIYEVRAGDTLFSIAEAENVQVSELIALNCLESVSGVHMGQLIRIPSDIDDFSLTATAILATATASADFGEAALIVPNAPDPLGCHNDNARILYPLNGQMIDRPVNVTIIASNQNFFRSTIEISGPSTNDVFVVLNSISEPAIVETELGQFVPAAYQGGDYKLRLNTFNDVGNQVGTCTITIYISDSAATTAEVNLRPVVIAVQDIPMNTLITANMVMLSYWPDEIALEFATENSGQWYMADIDSVVGMQSTDFIPAYQPIRSNMLMQDMGCECAILPMNRVAITIENADNSVRNFLAGERVDVIFAYNYQHLDESNVQIVEGEGELAIQRLVSNVQIIWVGAFPEDGSVLNPDNTLGIDITTDLTNSDRLVTLAVSAAHAEILESTLEMQLPVLVVPYIEGSESTAMQHD